MHLSVSMKSWPIPALRPFKITEWRSSSKSSVIYVSNSRAWRANTQSLKETMMQRSSFSRTKFKHNCRTTMPPFCETRPSWKLLSRNMRKLKMSLTWTSTTEETKKPTTGKINVKNWKKSMMPKKDLSMMITLARRPLWKTRTEFLWLTLTRKILNLMKQWDCLTAKQLQH